MKLLSTLLVALLLVGCTTLNNLQSASVERYIVLNEDIIFNEKRGPFRVSWLLGLRANTYTLVGEDKSYYYYLGTKNDDVIIVMDDYSYFEKTGEVPPSNMGGSGGLKVPKNSNEKLELFYISKGLYGEDPTPGSMGSITNNITTVALDSIFKGSITYFPFNLEPEIRREKIIIKHGKAPVAHDSVRN